MEMSSGQQKALFAVVVLILIGLGAYLVIPATRPGSRGTAGASPSVRPASAATPAGTSGSSAPAAVSSSGTPAVNIYGWLPFTQQDLASAAAAATQFGTDYETWSYTESAAAYTGKMAGVVTSELAQTLKNAYSTLGVAQVRSSQKQVSAGSAVIDTLRTFGSASITFVVTAAERLASTKGTSNTTTQYAVTVTQNGGAWQVNDIEPATAGNT
jgi:transcription elongation factor